MENYVYYFNQSKNSHEYQKIVQSSLFKEIIFFFETHTNERIILRQLKKEFHSKENIELFLDRMVDLNLISRINREYSLNFPIYTFNEYYYNLNIPENIFNKLDLIRNKTKEDVAACIEWLWKSLEPNQPYFFCIKQRNKTDFLIKKAVLTENNLDIITIYNPTDPPISIPIYFNFLHTMNALPNSFRVLENLVGDVNTFYFSEQVRKALCRSQKNQRTKAKGNIFEQSLLLTGNITSIDDRLYLENPILTTDSFLLLTEVLTEEKSEIESFLCGIEDNRLEKNGLNIVIKKMIQTKLILFLISPNTDYSYFIDSC